MWHKWVKQRLTDAEIVAIGREYLKSRAMVQVGPGPFDYRLMNDVPLDESDLRSLPSDFDDYRRAEPCGLHCGPVPRKQTLARSEMRLREFMRYKDWYRKPYAAPDEKPIRRGGD